MAETHLPDRGAFVADRIVARRSGASRLGAGPSSAGHYTKSKLWVNMIADSSLPVLQALRASPRCMLLIGAGRAGLLATTSAAHAQLG